MRNVTTPESMNSETILMDRQAGSMPHVVDIIAFINFSLRMGELAIAISPAQVPVAFVPRSIAKNDLAISVSEASEPLAFVLVASVLIRVLVVLQVLLKLNMVFRSKESGLNHSEFIKGLPVINISKLKVLGTIGISDLFHFLSGICTPDPCLDSDHPPDIL